MQPKSYYLSKQYFIRVQILDIFVSKFWTHQVMAIITSYILNEKPVAVAT